MEKSFFKLKIVNFWQKTLFWKFLNFWFFKTDFDWQQIEKKNKKKLSNPRFPAVQEIKKYVQLNIGRPLR